MFQKIIMIFSVVTARMVSHTTTSSSVEEDLKVEKIDSGVVIRMRTGENRLTPNFVRAMNKALDTVER